MNIQSFKKMIVRNTARTGLKLKAASPEILMVVGIAGVVGSTVLACRATLKAGIVLEAANDDLAQIKLAKETVSLDKYSVADYKKDLAITYAKTAVNFIGLYGPAILLGSISVACLVGSNRILKRRNVAMMAAYQAIESSFKRYRSRVVEEFGEKKDYNFKHGIYQVDEIVPAYTDEDGKKHKAEVVQKDVVRRTGLESEYAREFTSANRHWDPNWSFNQMFIQGCQNFANDKLQAQGHLFLNEVYDMLGFKRTEQGAVMGWVVDANIGDGYVDFGALDVVDFEYADKHHVKGIMLDFNVDGVIYDKI